VIANVLEVEETDGLRMVKVDGPTLAACVERLYDDPPSEAWITWLDSYQGDARAALERLVEEVVTAYGFAALKVRA